jgi:hypothetical protein
MAESTSFRITLAEVAPADPAFARLDARGRAEFLRAVVVFGIEEHKAQTARGIGANGGRLRPLALRTILHRKSAMGPADPHAPPLIPAHGLSRTASLLDGRAHADHALFFWRYDEYTDRGWGKMLAIHRRGNRRLPPRDVIGLSPGALQRVRARAGAWWDVHRARLLRLPMLRVPGPREILRIPLVPVPAMIAPPPPPPSRFPLGGARPGVGTLFRFGPGGKIEQVRKPKVLQRQAP